MVSSIPRFDAASISIKSIADPSLIDVHDSQELHGSELSIRSLQFRALAKILAIEVLPMPLVPVKR